MAMDRSMDLAQPDFRQHSSSHNYFDSHKAPSQYSSTATSMVSMTSAETSRSEGVRSTDAATLPITSQAIPHTGSAAASSPYTFDDKNTSTSSWDASYTTLPYQPASTTSQDVPYQQGYLPLSPAHWGEKPGVDSIVPHVLDSDGPIGQAYTTDEAIPIVDLKYANSVSALDYSQFYTGVNSRPVSGSSFTVSTSGAPSDIGPYEDFSTAMSDATSLNSEYPPASNRTSLMSSTQLSPIPSPRLTPQSRPEQVRSQSRGRASSSPRPSARSAPYNVDALRGTKRWSTGTTYASTPNKRPSLYGYSSSGPEVSIGTQPMSMNTPASRPLLPGSLSAPGSDYSNMPRPPYLMSDPSMMQRNSMLLPSQMPPQLSSQPFYPQSHRFDQPPVMPSQGLFRMLQSNGSPHTFHGHYTDLSDPPDLFAALHEEQLQPPPEDMNPEDPEMTPYEQDLRFEGDLYTPRWVRGHGNKREGWCGICKPGRWLVLKNSAYWYDKSFTHGISAATGSSFQEPLDSRRMDGSPDVWEGLCGSCNDWIALVSSKKKGTTWFRHAYKCHTHPKVKDSLKRRREMNQTRTIAAQVSLAKVKSEDHLPSTPPTGTSSAIGLHTPQSTDISHTTSYSPHRPQKCLAPAPLQLMNSNREFGLSNQFR